MVGLSADLACAAVLRHVILEKTLLAGADQIHGRQTVVECQCVVLPQGKALHGEQYIELQEALPTAATVVTAAQVRQPAQMPAERRNANVQADVRMLS
jgi:hypothetical protein